MKVQVRNKCSDFNTYRAARVKSLFNCDDLADVIAAERGRFAAVNAQTGQEFGE